MAYRVACQGCRRTAVCSDEFPRNQFARQQYACGWCMDGQARWWCQTCREKHSVLAMPAPAAEQHVVEVEEDEGPAPDKPKKPKTKKPLWRLDMEAQKRGRYSRQKPVAGSPQGTLLE